MGTDLFLIKNGKKIVNLGRAYHFKNRQNELEMNPKVLEKGAEDLKNEIIKKMNGYIGFVPGKLEMFTEILDDIEISFEDLKNELIGYGQKMLLAALVEEEGVELIEDTEYTIPDFSKE